jgi:hydroxypyruvate isomerase
MYELSACLEMLFTEVDFSDRIQAAADHQLSGVELWDWRNKDIPRIHRALSQASIPLISFVADSQCHLVDPASHEAFLRRLPESVAVATDLGTPFLVATAGNTRPDAARTEQHAAVVDVLRKAADIIADRDVTLILEPLNSRVDHRGTFLDTTAEGLQIVREVDSPRVRLLYDAYHSLVMDEDAERELAGAVDLVAHIQIADVPGRAEPGTGTVDWGQQLATFHALGYNGYIGLEYRPSGETGASLQPIKEIASR